MSTKFTDTKRHKILDSIEKIQKETDYIEDQFSITELMEELAEYIKTLPRYKTVKCCSSEFTVDTLDIYFNCPSCKKRKKLRAFSSWGSDIEDVIVVVRDWLNQGE